jgi:hypothetical protein
MDSRANRILPYPAFPEAKRPQGLAAEEEPLSDLNKLPSLKQVFPLLMLNHALGHATLKPHALFKPSVEAGPNSSQPAPLNTEKQEKTRKTSSAFSVVLPKQITETNSDTKSPAADEVEDNHYRLVSNSPSPKPRTRAVNSLGREITPNEY